MQQRDVFLIKRPSHLGIVFLSTEGSYTNTGMLMAKISVKMSSPEHYRIINRWIHKPSPANALASNQRLKQLQWPDL